MGAAKGAQALNTHTHTHTHTHAHTRAHTHTGHACVRPPSDPTESVTLWVTFSPCVCSFRSASFYRLASDLPPLFLLFFPLFSLFAFCCPPRRPIPSPSPSFSLLPFLWTMMLLQERKSCFLFLFPSFFSFLFFLANSNCPANEPAHDPAQKRWHASVIQLRTERAEARQDRSKNDNNQAKTRQGKHTTTV